MASRQIIQLPSGKKTKVFFSKEQSKLDIVNNVLLPAWKNYCERHWLDERPDNQFSPEQRVKRFLDSLAYLLLRDDPEGTLTTYKMIVRGSSEIDVSSCPAEIEDALYGNGVTQHESSDIASFEVLLEKLDHLAAPYKQPRKQKEKPLTRFEKIERIKSQYPGCVFDILEIDTENIFEHDGQEYRIDDSVEQYQPKKTKEGLLYDMDRVVVVTDSDGELHFFDQRLDEIDGGQIHVLGDLIMSFDLSEFMED